MSLKNINSIKSIKTRVISYFLLVPLLLNTAPISAKILDKVLAVFDDKIVTRSEVERIGDNQAARRNISPQIYFKENLSQKEIIDIVINTIQIREKLAEIGYKIGDDQVEEQIKMTEKRLNLSRDMLLKFLQGNNISFEEYFELIRATIEQNIFRSKIIIPLISITDQQIKNVFFNRNLSKNKTLAFKYSLLSFSIEKNKVSPAMEKVLLENIKKYHASGFLPEELKDLETTDLGNITEEGLSKDMLDLLKKTDEGSFSDIILMNNQHTVFLVRKKDLVESEIFQSAKGQIRDELYEQEANKIASVWLEREGQKHFIKLYLEDL